MALEWLTESIRISLFSPAAIAVTDRDWHAFTGQEEAEARQTVPGGRVFAGSFRDGRLSIGAAVNRLDIIYSPTTAVETVSSTFPNVGAWDSVRDQFFALTSKWIESQELTVIRVAVGAVLLSPTETNKDSYLALQRLLRSVAVDPDHMRELIFRVNWPTESTIIQGLLVNRITHWSALQYFLRAIPLSAATASVETSPAFAVRLECDHNTDLAHANPFDRNQIIPIYSELLKLASENAIKGEKP